MTMAWATVDGIRTRYEMIGEGPPVLMFSPGGFDAGLENWTHLGRYRELDLVRALCTDFTCVLFDRRESGQSGGRVERLSWAGYVAQARGLLDHLGIDATSAIGGCVGCSSALALAVAEPARVRRLVLLSPAGGPRYRIQQHRRFAIHRAYVAEEGLGAVASLARRTTAGFSAEPRLGPWVAPLRGDDAFAARYGDLDADVYDALVEAIPRTLFDRDTVPGFEAEDLMGLRVPALIVPGEDRSHAPSAARYLQECLPSHDYWDVAVNDQTPAAVQPRIRRFLNEC